MRGSGCRRGRADLGLIPIAALTAGVANRAGMHDCQSGAGAVDSDCGEGGWGGWLGSGRWRRIRLPGVSVAYAEVLFRHFLGIDPEFQGYAGGSGSDAGGGGMRLC